MIYLSIVIPVRNEEMFIGETLHALVMQDYPKDRFEIIVVDGRSTDTTRDIVEQFIERHRDISIRLLDNPEVLSSRGRNIGIRETKGSLVGIIDGHVFIPNNKLFMNMEHLKENNGALSLARPAPLDVPGLKSGRSFWIAVSRKSSLGHSRKSYIYSDFEGFVDPMSSGFAYDRHVFEHVGYFDESFDAAEDVEFHFRLKKAGIMAWTSPKLLIYSFPRESFLALFKQQVRYGEGRARFIKKHPDGFSWETVILVCIFLITVLLPFAILCLAYLPSIGIMYIAIMLAYWAIVLITGLREALTRGRFFPGILVALGICTTHMGLGWGLVKEILFPQRFYQLFPWVKGKIGNEA